MMHGFLYKSMDSDEIKDILKEQVKNLKKMKKKLDKDKISFEEYNQQKNNIDCIMTNCLRELWERHNNDLISQEISEEDLMELDEIRKSR